MRSQSLGIATSAAVVLHDVPQEVREESDYPGTEFRRQTVAGDRAIFVDGDGRARSMTTASAQYHESTPWTSEGSWSHRRALLACGVLGAVLYPLADIFAATRYPGFSYRDQAVSELFAIGAPTSGLVVPLFSAASALLFLFAIGIWKSADGQRWVRPLAVMMALNAVDALVLWNVFPMHMRGEPQTFTDTMHGLLAIDPFLLAATVLGAIAFQGRFRAYTVASIVVTSILAMSAFVYVSDIIANQPTPWMGAFERASQYITNLWYAVLAVMLLRREPRRPLRAISTPPQADRFTALGLERRRGT